VFPASIIHDRLIGRLSSCETGGLVTRHPVDPVGSQMRCKMYRLYVGIAISKDSFSVAGLDFKGNALIEGSYGMDAEGFSLFLEMVFHHCKDLSQILVAMESTGCYHLNLFSFLNEQGIEAVVINPLLISNFAKLSLRKTKTDKKDAMTIAQFILQHQDAVSQLAVSQKLQDLRDLARERESLCHLVSATKSEIKRVLRTTFPELESLCDISTKVMLQFLKQYPSARMVKSAKPKDLIKALERKGVGTRLIFSAQDIIRAARDSVGIVSPAKEIILQGKVSTLVHLQERVEQMTKLMTALCKASMLEDLEIVTSIKGIKTKTAVPFLAEVGNIKNYSCYKKLIAFAGLDPSVRQSGKFVGQSKISKRGNRHLRRALYLMASSVVKSNSFFRCYFIKKKKEGMSPQKALFAVAHKLTRIIFAMLTHKTYFNLKEVSVNS
jgi:transposase